MLSRFDAASDLSQLNRSELTLSPVSAPLFSALQAALWAAEVTGGLYDPTLLAELEQAGYDRSFDQIVERAQFQWPVAAPRPLAGAGGVERRPFDWRSVQLEAEQQAVRRPRGLRFDLGGMGKGWTVDRAADLLHGQGPFLVNAGGDLYAGGRPDGVQGWRVEIEHPLRPEDTIASLQLQDAALATSTVTKRRWRKDGGIRHHLIDPRSGQPAQTDALSVSVIARRTLVAEVHAKAALLLGAEAGLAYLAASAGRRRIDLPQRRAGTVHGRLRTAARRPKLTRPPQPGSLEKAALPISLNRPGHGKERMTTQKDPHKSPQKRSPARFNGRAKIVSGAAAMVALLGGWNAIGHLENGTQAAAAPAAEAALLLHLPRHCLWRRSRSKQVQHWSRWGSHR